MKFKAKETSRMNGTGDVWIIKDKIYDLKENSYGDGYVFKSENCNNHYAPKEDLHCWFEAVEEVKKPRICEILGVEVGEEFAIQFRKKDSTGNYFFDENGYIYNSYKQELNRYISDLLNGKFKIIKLPKYTDEEKEIFKALKVLGLEWIARDKSRDVLLYTNKPYKEATKWDISDGDYVEIPKLLNMFPFIKWEDEEPFEIPNIE